MNKQKYLKRELKDKYIFKNYLSANYISSLVKVNQKLSQELVFASLSVGCVKLVAVVFYMDNKVRLGYDLYVKSSLSSEGWICFDTLTDKVKYDCLNLEKEMLRILDSKVKSCNLSYSECNFEILEGKVINTK